MSQRQQLVSDVCYGSEVMVRIVAYTRHHSIQCGIKYLSCAIAVAHEGQCLSIGSPDVCLAVVVIIGCEVLELSDVVGRFVPISVVTHWETIEVHYQKCILVTLVAIAGHCLKGKKLAVW